MCTPRSGWTRYSTMHTFRQQSQRPHCLTDLGTGALLLSLPAATVFQSCRSEYRLQTIPAPSARESTSRRSRRRMRFSVDPLTSRLTLTSTPAPEEARPMMDHRASRSAMGRGGESGESGRAASRVRECSCLVKVS